MALSTVSMPAFAETSGDLVAEINALKAQVKEQQKLLERMERRLQSQAQKQEEDLQDQNTKLVNQRESIEKLETKQAVAKTSGVLGDVKISMAPAPKVESVDGRFSFQPVGRVNLDYASFNDDKTNHPDAATFRRARLGFKGKVDSDIEYKLEFDFGNKGSSESASFKDVYIAYSGFKPVSFKIGNFKPALGLAELISSSNTTFIEIANPVSTFTTSEIIGAQIYGGGNHYSWALGVHNDKSTVKSSSDEARSVVGRVTYAPIAREGLVLHMGAAISYREPDTASESVSFSTKAENSLQTKYSAITPSLTSVDHVTITGLEAAGVYGPLSLQGEYMHTKVARSATSLDNNFSGWYAQASWVLTGESRPYSAKSGTFSGIKPNHNFSIKGKGLGAWEVAVRYSAIDLNDAGVNGGGLRDVTLGLNWYLNPYTKLMANYIIVNGDNTAPSPSTGVPTDDDPRIALFRAQVAF